MTPVSGWGILGGKHTFCLQNCLLKAGTNGKFKGLMRKTVSEYRKSYSAALVFPVCNGQDLSNVFQGRSSEQATGSWERAKTH